MKTINNPSLFDQADHIMRTNGRSIIQSFFPGGVWKRSQYVIRSPLRHDNKAGSFSINGKGLYNDFATGDKGNFIQLLAEVKRVSRREAAELIIKVNGGSVEIIDEAIDHGYMDEEDIQQESERKNRPEPMFPQPSDYRERIMRFARSDWFRTNRGEITGIYPYADPDGNVQYFTMRCEKKGQKVVLPVYVDISGRVINKLPELEKYYPYNIQDAVTAERILIVEGEKCASIKVNGYAVVTWRGGAASVGKTDWSLLADKQIVIWPDADEAGYKAAQKLLSYLPHAEIMIIEDKPQGWDIADASNDGVNVEDFIENCPKSKTKPRLDIDDHRLDLLVKRAWSIIKKQNEPPKLFIYGSSIVELTWDDEMNAGFAAVDKFKLQLVSSATTNWFKVKVKNDQRCELNERPPLIVMQSMLACGSIPLPVIRRIVYSPVFTARGDLVLRKGYHPESRIFLSSGPLVLRNLPDTITKSDVDEAVALIETMISDFVFSTEADKATVYATLLSLPMREFFECMPMTIIESPSAGSGKTLLSECIAHIVTGNYYERMTPVDDEAEERKRITATLAGGKPMILLDNVSVIKGANLASLITKSEWNDRKLGESTNLSFRLYLQLIATGNNIQFTNEIARRIIRCRIQPNNHQPWLRSGFKIDNLLEWVRKNRADLVYAILILCRYWIQEGSPRYTDRMFGSFYQWAQVIGGILLTAGIPGFLENFDELHAVGDFETEQIEVMVTKWYSYFGSRPVTATELFERIKSDELHLEGVTQAGGRRSFSWYIPRLKDRIVEISDGDGEIKVQIVHAGKVKRASLWKLQVISSAQDADGQLPLGA